jgi:hypothetical protein
VAGPNQIFFFFEGTGGGGGRGGLTSGSREAAVDGDDGLTLGSWVEASDGGSTLGYPLAAGDLGAGLGSLSAVTVVPCGNLMYHLFQQIQVWGACPSSSSPSPPGISRSRS